MPVKWVMRVAPVLLLGCVSLPSFLAAQDRPARVLGTHVNNHPSDAFTSIRVSEDGRVSLVSRRDARPVRWSFQTGVAFAGSYCLTESDALRGLIVAGRGEKGSGVLEHWLPDSNGQWVRRSRLEMPGADFAGVACGAGAIYVLDCVSRRLLKAAWMPSDDLGGVQLAEVWTDLDVPLLAEASDLFVRWVPAGHLPRVDRAALLFLEWWQCDLPVNCHWIDPDSPWPVARPYVLGGDDETVAFVVADRQTAIAGNRELSVVATGGLRFEVVDDAGRVVGGGIGSATESRQRVRLDSDLELGRVYIVRDLGSGTSDRFECVRKGLSESLSDGITLSGLTLAFGPSGARSSVLTVRLRLERRTELPASRPCHGLLLLGDGLDACDRFEGSQGHHWLVRPACVAAVMGEVAGGMRVGLLAASWNVPVSVPLLGRDLLGQLVVPDGGHVRLSEVVMCSVRE